MQKILVIGHLGDDAKVRDVKGETVITFAIAQNKKFVNQQTGEEVSQTNWFSVSYWTQKTKVADYLKKGTQAYVEGEVSAAMYLDKQNQTQIDLRIRASKVEMLGTNQPKKETEDEQKSVQKTKKSTAKADVEQFEEEVNLPF